MMAPVAHLLLLFLLTLLLLHCTPSAAFIPYDAESPHAITTTPPPPAEATPAVVPRADDAEEEDNNGNDAVQLAKRAQVPPVTTYYIQSFKGTSVIYATVAYTQTFPAVPDQWPSPSAGTIGLGTISGEVGVVRTTSAK